MLFFNDYRHFKISLHFSFFFFNIGIATLSFGAYLEIN